jgi:hypothetical protein
MRAHDRLPPGSRRGPDANELTAAIAPIATAIATAIKLDTLERQGPDAIEWVLR